MCDNGGFEMHLEIYLSFFLPSVLPSDRISDLWNHICCELPSPSHTFYCTNV